MPDQHVYAIASGKGGVGKTTTAVTLGAVAAADGRSVVVVDADLGMPDLAAVLDVPDDGATLHDVLAGEADAVEAATPVPGGFDVLPGADDVEKFGGADPAALRDAVAALREAYDLVLLDTGAGLSHATVVPLGLADAVVVVTTPDPVAAGDATRTRDVARRFGGEVAGVVVVGIGGGGMDPEAVAEGLSVPLLASVPADPAVRESAAAGEPLPVAAPDSAAASAYRRAAAALAGDAGAVEADGSDGDDEQTEADDDEQTEADDADPATDGADDGAVGDDAPSVPDADGVTLTGPETPGASVPEGEVSIGADDPDDSDDATPDEPAVPGGDAAGVSFSDGATAPEDEGGVTFSGPDDDDSDDLLAPDDAADDSTTDDTVEADAADGSTETDPVDDDSGDGDYVRGGDDGEDAGDDGDDDDGDERESSDETDDDAGESRSLLSRLTGGLLG